MSSAKLAVVLMVAATGLSACASTAKPLAGANGQLASRGRIDDPRTAKADRVKCMQQDHLQVQNVGATDLQIGPSPGAPTVHFDSTPGAAQADQIEAREQGAEVIGAALLYPNQGSAGELSQIESCLSKGVSG